MPRKRSPIIAHHPIRALYGHWLANNLRGSGSHELHEEKFAPLGPVCHGRKPAHLQPSRLREFYRQAHPLLKFSKFWLDATKRQAWSEVFGKVVAKEDYTEWACAVLSNHVSLVVRRHRDDALTMWHRFADASRLRLCGCADISAEHPIWSERPDKVFLTTSQAARACVAYVEQNPEKEGLPDQSYPFVPISNNWPFPMQT